MCGIVFSGHGNPVSKMEKVPETVGTDSCTPMNVPNISDLCT